MPKYDYIIVGSGIAGLYTALLARQLGTVLILTKGTIEETNTRYAQGGIAAAIGSNDSTNLHFEDTLAAGAGLSDPEHVRILVDEAADRIQDLINFGVPFDTIHGEIALTREGAHSRDRILHAGGDATGEQIEMTLSRLAQMSRITVLENILVTDVIVEQGRATGVRTLDARTDLAADYEGHFILLTTGGAGRIFRYTTNSPVATGDGVALAYRANAEIRDMEFYQFHPTALRLPGAPPFLISEAVRGEGAILRNKQGKAFAKNYHNLGDLAPRDIVARALLSEMAKDNSDNVFLDVTHLHDAKIATRFPTIYKTCLSHGIDMAKDWIPVSPAAHYMMGGIVTNTWGETTVPGLFTCGETACTGVHGANRLASNSLLEVLIFGKRLIQKTKSILENKEEMSGIPTSGGSSLAKHSSRDTNDIPLSFSAIQNLMWEQVGMIRNGHDLGKASQTLASWEMDLANEIGAQNQELRNVILTARLMAEAALQRTESRGAHSRSDFDSTANEWEKHINFQKSPS